MEVKILGTGSTYSESNCTSIIIDKNILIDLSPGTTKQLLKAKYDLRSINTILITHLHFDHILDFPIFISNIKILKIKHKINIYGPKDTKDKLLSLLEILDETENYQFANNNLNFIEIYNNQEINTNNYFIKVKKVVHNETEAYGFIINSHLGITGDSTYCKNIEEIYKASDILICDCSVVKSDIYHMGIDSIISLQNIDNTKKIIPIHYRDETKKILKEMNLKNIVIVKDGYEFTIE